MPKNDKVDISAWETLGKNAGHLGTAVTTANQVISLGKTVRKSWKKRQSRKAEELVKPPPAPPGSSAQRSPSPEPYRQRSTSPEYYQQRDYSPQPPQQGYYPQQQQQGHYPQRQIEPYRQELDLRSRQRSLSPEAGSILSDEYSSDEN